jgi:ankyrin repeat protein
VLQGWTALLRAARYNELSVAEILLKAGADVNDRDRGVCDGDVWDTTQMDMQYSLCRLTSLHFTSLLQLVVTSSVLFLCWYFMSIFMFMFIVCECVISAIMLLFIRVGLLYTLLAIGVTLT